MNKEITELNIDLSQVNPVELLGPGEKHLETFRQAFPEITIVARGHNIKLKGAEQSVQTFKQKFDALLQHYSRYGQVSNVWLDQLLEKPEHGSEKEPYDAADELIVYGNNGLIIKARTANQRRIFSSSRENDMVFAIGPAGTGKTYTAVAIAVRALKNKEVKKIILTRPAVEAGENLGFLPGDMKEKLDPYLQPLYDALRDMLPVEKLNQYIESSIIQIAPLAFMRGRTLDHAFVLLDEAQNATRSQLKMFLTRMGRSAKFIITGDITQVDLPKSQPSGLIQAREVLKDVAGIDFIDLDVSDVVRHKLVADILKAYGKHAAQNIAETTHGGNSK